MLFKYILSISVSVLFLSLYSFPQVQAQNNHLSWQSKVQDQVFEDLERMPFSEIIIELDLQSDLSFSRSLQTKSAKGQYVFQKLTSHAKTNQSHLIEYLNDEGIEYKSFWIVNAIWSKCTYDQINWLAKRSEVRRIQANIHLQRPEILESSPQIQRNPQSLEWGIEKINADDVWNLGFDGSGVTIGGQDTGYDWDHEALKSQYRGWNGSIANHNYNWHDAIHQIEGGNIGTNPCGFDSQIPCDDDYHGTHTMGTMVGDGPSTKIGVAPGAKWIGCRNMERGDGTPATYLECFEWFLAPTDLTNSIPLTELAPHVINNSWSCPPVEGCEGNYDFSLMETAINNLQDGGIVVVVSAGNDGPECATIENPPAFYPSSFSVGATDINDEIANFSSRGPNSGYGSPGIKPNVSAPGVAVNSSKPNDQYGIHSGTSMAGPHVAGVVALLIEANPDLGGDVAGIELILEQSAIPLTSIQSCGGISGNSIPNNTFGHGRIDALAAVNMALGNVALELLSFYGKVLDNNIFLEWKIQNTENEILFIVEKSQDTQSWFPIGKIFIGEENEFSFTDPNPFIHNNYYRLKMIDHDGIETFSKKINVPYSNQNKFYLFPNPLLSNTLFISTGFSENNQESISIQIFSSDGKLIKNLKDLVHDENAIPILLNDLQKGVYLLKITTGNVMHKTEIFRFSRI